MAEGDAEMQGFINIVESMQRQANREIAARLAYQASPGYVPPPPSSRWTRAKWRVKYGIRDARAGIARWISPYDDCDW